MALTYICDYCDTNYDAEIRNGKLVYTAGDSFIHAKNEREDCVKCKNEAETARQQTLENIRHKRGQNGSTKAL